MELRDVFMKFNAAIESAILLMSESLEPFGEDGIELDVCESHSTFVNRVEINPGEYEIIQRVRCDGEGGVDVKFLNKDEWYNLETLKDFGVSLDWAFLAEKVDDKVSINQ